MFKFLRDKIKSAVSRISEKIENEGKTEETDAPKELPEAQKAQEAKHKEASHIPEPAIEQTPQAKEEKHEKKGFFSAVTSLFKKKEEERTEEPAPEKPQEEEPEELPAIAHETELPTIAKDESHKLRELQKPKPTTIPQPTKTLAPIKARGKRKKEEKPEEQEAQKKAAQPEKQEGKAIAQQPKEHPKEKKGFFSALKEKMLTTTVSEKQFEELFFEMDLALLENNVAVEVIEKIKHDLKEALVDLPIRRTKVEETVVASLKESIRGLFEKPFDLVGRIREKREKPFIISFVGINGSGKTTSIAKVASLLKEKGFSVVLAAGDTFRAASIEQLSRHGELLGIKVVKHDYGADPAAVAFDAIKHAHAKGIDIVLIDTAGRMNSNTDLVNEMKKIMRVARPDLKIFVGESITGNDCVEQAKTFNDAVGIDGIILTKADVDEKGGAAVSISFVTKKPILYIGTGQGYNDLEPFDSAAVMENLGLA